MRPKGPLHQAGAAIIAAMLVVLLAALLVGGLIWRESVQMRRVEAARLSDQAQWIERGALDWTRLILRATGDATPTVDYLGQVWSMPVAPTKLSDFLTQIGAARAEEGGATYLSGDIVDLQGRFNLRNLVSPTAAGKPGVDQNAVAAYARLLGFLGLDPGLAPITAQRLAAALAPLWPVVPTPNSVLTPSGSVSSTPTVTPVGTGGVAPLLPTTLDGLLDIPGYTPDVLVKLSPYVTILPTTTAVNVNTAPAEVIAAVVPDLSLSVAQAAVLARGKAYFRNLGDFANAVHANTADMTNAAELDVRTHYFAVHGVVRHERAELAHDTVIYRTGITPNATRIIDAREPS